MKTSLLLLGLCALAALANGAVKLTSTCPYKVNGKLTGQIAARVEQMQELTRVKRQGGRGGRRPRPNRPAPPTTAPPTRAPRPPTPAPATPAPRPPTPAPATPAPATPAPATPAPATPAPATPAPATPAPATPAPATPAPSACAAASNVYRSADGSCNNLDNPQWGATLATFRRLLPPVYQSTNGVNVPVLNSALSGAPLSGARAVSARVHTGLNRPDQRVPVMVMQWGQFLDHDVTGTPVEPNTDNTACCSSALVTSGAAQHSDVESGEGPCFPILIGADDQFFTTAESRCLEFTRSLRTIPDGETEEQQLNLLTSYIDGSNVYGTSEEETESLRGADGLLLEGNPGHLPQGADTDCDLTGANDYCLKAGDHRANVFPGLGAMHTVFLRHHNRVATALKVAHPGWSSDHIFQETRKLVGALMQRITYSEYLPSILGPAAMAQYGLSSGSGDTYDVEVDSSLANVFSAAAFRFGHSAIPGSLSVDGRRIPIQNLFNDPGAVLNSLQSLVEGLLADPAQEVDRWYTPGMTNHLFETEPEDGTDIVSLNIQRGRDHGLAPYNEWRDYCGLARVGDFRQMGPGGRVYMDVYDSVEDIDLYSGALNEPMVAGGSVGETYACLLGLQFSDLKHGDRFWHERETSEGFTAGQLAEIQKMTLSGVLCDAFDDQLTIQPNAFNLAGLDGGNQAVSCASIPRMSLDLW